MAVLASCTSGTSAAGPSGSPSGTTSASLTPGSPTLAGSPPPTTPPPPPVAEARLEGTFLAAGFVPQLKFDPSCKKGPCDAGVDVMVVLDKKTTKHASGELTLKGGTYKGTLDVETDCVFQGGPTFHPPAHLELEIDVLRGAFVHDVWRASKVRIKAKLHRDKFVSTSTSGFTTTTYTCGAFSFGDGFVGAVK
ncbi:MAG: hypothetical protein HY240_10645 [Actinobacteria bacterium]|nr:hypothetical protein [Actinomycetota bacterium]